MLSWVHTRNEYCQSSTHTVWLMQVHEYCSCVTGAVTPILEWPNLHWNNSGLIVQSYNVLTLIPEAGTHTYDTFGVFQLLVGLIYGSFVSLQVHIQKMWHCNMNDCTQQCHVMVWLCWISLLSCRPCPSSHKPLGRGVERQDSLL